MDTVWPVRFITWSQLMISILASTVLLCLIILFDGGQIPSQPNRGIQHTTTRVRCASKDKTLYVKTRCIRLL